jgi:ABC-type multidrug transport system ATPase subunit
MAYVASRKVLATLLNRTKAKEVRAVEGVNLDVDPGTWLGLLGPNGSGKTTLLKLIAGLVNPTKGSAHVMGYDTVKESEKVLDRVHFVPGLTTGCIWIDGTLTVRQNLEFIGGLYGFGSDDVDEAIHLVGLAQVLDQRTGTLSTGMTARMILALGLMREVPVYLFDEPVTGLDVLAIRSFSNMIRERIGNKGVVIYASHMLNEIERTCNEIAFLREGRLVAKDSLRNVKNRLGPGEHIVVRARPRQKISLLQEGLASEGIHATTEAGPAEGADSNDASLALDISRRNQAEAARVIFQLAETNGLRITSLTLSERSLEEVFANLIGREGNAVG